MTCYDILLSGQVYNAVVCLFEASFAYSGGTLFWVIVSAFVLAAVFIQTRDFGLVTITALVAGGAGVIDKLPLELHGPTIFLIILGLAGVSYGLVKGIKND